MKVEKLPDLTLTYILRFAFAAEALDSNDTIELQKQMRKIADLNNSSGYVDAIKLNQALKDTGHYHTIITNENLKKMFEEFLI